MGVELHTNLFRIEEFVQPAARIEQDRIQQFTLRLTGEKPNVPWNRKPLFPTMNELPRESPSQNFL